MPKKIKNNWLIKFCEVLVCVLPAVLYFSYYPMISFGSDETMNFELSLPILWLVLFDVVGVVVLAREKLVKETLGKWKYLLFPVFVTLSVLWSSNMVRGVLTCGVMWLMILAMILIVQLKPLFLEGFSRRFLKWFFGATLVVCAWCFLQCILDVFGVSREYTLMCAGCTSYSFGFPHPNGFAIEPQFMGNLLLAPTTVMAWLVLKDDSNSTLRGRGSSRPSSRGSDPSLLGRDFRKPLRILLLAVFSATLFLTFSRGAIYAFVVAMVFMMVWAGVQQKSWKVLKVLGIIVLAFLFTLNLQGVLAQVSPTNDTYVSGVTKALNHLSLGVIDVREQDKVDDGEVVEYDAQGKEYDSVYDGYVAESTEVRKMLTRNAIKTWSRDFKTVMFGVGIGGAGQAMYDEGLIDSPKEIVQNEYASALLEVGLTGVILAVILVLMVIFVVIKRTAAMVILTLLLAYGISLIFFAGLPNALQIYLLPVILWLVFKKH